MIHNDFERGFIKAEVVAYDEFIACGGSHAGVKAAGKLRLEEGKPLREVALTEEERHGIRSFSFWTIRPELVVINTPEENPAIADAFAKEAGLSVPVVGICCAIEA